jgi:uncharacterized protein YegP (UPF0339 family)
MSLKISFAVLALVGSAALTCACSAPVDSVDDGSVDLASKSAHFETFVGMDGQYYFDLVAGNGQNVLRSEGYQTSQGAKNGIASVEQNGVDSQQFEVLQAKDGEYYFNLLADNHEVIGTSEMYTTKYSAQRGAKTVRGLVLLLGANPQVKAAVRQERFEVFTGEDKKFYFHLRAGNGEIVLSSQAYTAKSSALGGIGSVQTNGATTSHFEVIETLDGQYAFHLKAANGQIIGRSESYVSKSNAQRGIDAVVKIVGDRPPVAQ